MRRRIKPATLGDYQVLASTRYYTANEVERFECQKHRIRSIKPTSILEVGCGRGEFLRWAATKTDAELAGIDPALNPNWNRVQAHANLLGKEIDFDVSTILGCTTGADLVCSFDVLEHIPTDEVDETLRHLDGLASRAQCHCISSGPDLRRVDGVVKQMHLTDKPATWWLNRFKEVDPHKLYRMGICQHRPQFRFAIWALNRGKK